MLVLTAGAGAEVSADGVPVKDYIRLHVLASDDGEAAQALKLEVRDACLMCARIRARVSGWEGGVSAEAGVFDFPDRRYGGVEVPAGAYRAVRIVIGGGAGHNWWCVLFPSLCLGEDCAPGEPVEFHSTVLDWLCGLAGGGA